MMRPSRLLILFLLIGGLWWWADRLIFYGQMSYVYLIGQRFYQQYPYLTKDIAYHPTRPLTLDVYRPPHGEAHAVIIFLHGGLEPYATKEMFALVGKILVAQEIVVVLPDYTLYPQGRYPDMADEVAAALHWTAEHVDEYGGDPQQIIIAGHSSGAYLGALVLLDEQYLARYGQQATDFCGLISVAGVYDMTAQYRYEETTGHYLAMLQQLIDNDTAHLAPASPLSYSQAESAPMLLLHGAQDITFPVSQAIRFQQARYQAKGDSRLKIYPRAGHTDLMFDAVWQSQSPMVRDWLDFVERCEER